MECNIRNCIVKRIKENCVPFNNIGSICGNILFVLPYYDENMVTDLKRIYEEVTGKNLEENHGITYAVKCNVYSNYKIYDNSIITCGVNFMRLCRNGTYKHIYLFGDAYKLFYKDKPNIRHATCCYENRRYHLVLYNSLAVKNHNTDLYNDVVNKLKRNIITDDI